MNGENPRRRRRIETSLCAPLKAPRFSILVPVYNPPLGAFQEMITGVIEQTFAGWELILVDDASPDPRVRQEMAWQSGRDGRIRSIHREENGNISVATNQAAAAARGNSSSSSTTTTCWNATRLLISRSISMPIRRPTWFIATMTRSTSAAGVIPRSSSPTGRPSYCSPSAIRAISRAFADGCTKMLAACASDSKARKTMIFGCAASERARHVGHIPQILYHWRGSRLDRDEWTLQAGKF